MDELRNKGGKKAVTVAIIANTFLTVFNIIVECCLEVMH